MKFTYGSIFLVALGLLISSVNPASADHRRGSGLGLWLGDHGIELRLDRRWDRRRYERRSLRTLRKLHRRHFRYCEYKYRSYNRRNNTWVDYRGRVRRCWSPHLQELRGMRRHWR